MPASSGGRRASSSSSRRSTNTNNGPPPSSSSATATTTITTVMLRASVLVAMLAVALPTGWRWWQQHAALNDRGTVLEVRPELQFARRYQLGAGFNLAWASGGISIWRAHHDDASDATTSALWCVSFRGSDRWISQQSGQCLE